MGMLSYKEYDLSLKIINGEEKYFAINSKDIKGINIGGYDKNLRFVSYPVSEHESEVIVLELMYDGERFFFKPLCSDDYLLILGEDYYYGDCPDLSLGEIRLSTNRMFQMLRGRYGILNNIDYSSVEDNKSLVIDNPLGVYLDSVEPLSVLPNNGFKMVQYNYTYSDDLKHKIGRMKYDAQTTLLRAYEQEKKFLKKNNG